MTEDEHSPPPSCTTAVHDDPSARALKRASSQFDAQQREDDEWNQAPSNPLNWSSGRKWVAVGEHEKLSLHFFVTTPLASSVMAPGLPGIGAHYNITTETVLALTLSIFVLAWSVGPLLGGPLSEIYGRRPILILSTIIFLIFNTACIFAPNTGAFIFFRFAAGLGASTPISVGGSLIGDLFVPAQRARPVAVSFLGVMIGPPTGPIMGGYIAQSVGFKYSFVVTSALALLSFILAALFLQETYGPVVRGRWEKLSGAISTHTEPSDLERQAEVDAWRTLWLGLARPIQHLTQSFVCFILSLYGAVIYGILIMFFTTFPTVFGDEYGFSVGTTGLTYIGGGLGEIAAVVLGGYIADKIYHSLVLKNDGQAKPEYRIPPMLPGAAIVPIGLLWYGWSAEARLHWIMPIIGSSIFGYGLIATLVPIQMYLVDSFRYAASALAASSALRFAFGFALPLAGPPMIARMGLGGTYTFLAGVMLVLGIPFPIWIFYRGEELRKHNRWAI
ncbi:MFS general substrate transporter [Stereum hirsutum FP-91666 SS1]|uniref:MFS general substrate transporter n=1 Tax=Stereum hirsutum (strain FP-91666) TaxID=721885 RepID=UPI000440B17D|nr:MFS general substrate transporter [Stereum hirsutum FP-91666 SS1]EIM88767.1 MFS general substrate transporter [Stereum hirsutum FP-91666 SS1]